MAIVQQVSARYQIAANTNWAETLVELPNQERLNIYIKSDGTLAFKREPTRGANMGAETVIGTVGNSKFLDVSIAPDGTVYVCCSTPDVHTPGTTIGIIVYKGANNGVNWSQFYRLDNTMTNASAHPWSDTRWGVANVTAFTDAVFVGVQYHQLYTDSAGAVTTDAYSLAVRKLNPTDGTQIAPNSGMSQSDVVGWTGFKIVKLTDKLRIIQAHTSDTNSRQLMYRDSLDGFTGEMWDSWTALATLSDPVADVGARSSLVLRAYQQGGGTNQNAGKLATSGWILHDTYQQIGDGGYIFAIAGYVKNGATTGWWGPMSCYSSDYGATWSAWTSLYWRESTDMRCYTLGQVVQNVSPGYWKAVFGWTEAGSNAWLSTWEVNKAPGSVLLSTPTNGAKVEPGSATVEFVGTIGAEFEHEDQHFEWKFATDSNFTAGLVTAASATTQGGWSIQQPGSTTWDPMPATGASYLYAGGKVRFTYTFTAVSNQNYYWQMRPKDPHQFGLWSNPFDVLAKNGSLQMVLKTPISTTAAAKRMVVSAIYALATDGATPASITVEACNNANDAAPAWEDMTSQFKAKQAFNFTNSAKTDANWAVNVRFTITANDSTGISYIDGFGVSFD